MRITEEDENNNDEVLFDSIIEGSDVSNISYKETIDVISNSNRFEQNKSKQL